MAVTPAASVAMGILLLGSGAGLAATLRHKGKMARMGAVLFGVALLYGLAAAGIAYSLARESPCFDLPNCKDREWTAVGLLGAAAALSLMGGSALAGWSWVRARRPSAGA